MNRLVTKWPAVKIVVRMLHSTTAAMIVDKKGLEPLGPGSSRTGGLLPDSVTMIIAVA